MQCFFEILEYSGANNEGAGKFLANINFRICTLMHQLTEKQINRGNDALEHRYSRPRTWTSEKILVIVRLSNLIPQSRVNFEVFAIYLFWLIPQCTFRSNTKYSFSMGGNSTLKSTTCSKWEDDVRATSSNHSSNHFLEQRVQAMTNFVQTEKIRATCFVPTQ